MIINKNTNPKKDLYYFGAKIIEVLDASKNKDVDYFQLYETFNEQHNISIVLFDNALTWLFILGVIKRVNKLIIEKCF